MNQPPQTSQPDLPAVSHLGKRSALSPEELANPRLILDTFDNPRTGRAYEIKFVFPEFTSMCPVTGQPDFATITIIYVPGDRCVEMKSMKLYFQSYRNRGCFYEAVVNTILDDLVATLSPVSMTVIGEFNVRGGTAGVITAKHDRETQNAERRTQNAEKNTSRI
ncbi:MAG: NADPH-dependent 7-cyano-7-deazaguanine reductase QueF [Phycisphaerae bacterium]|nr:NADPH-dependent 7-cyano-7-deazaguanine reductase QueF [Phycisphaerae bacterium]